MNELIAAIMTGFAAFTATNLDDIVVLLLFFSQVSPTFRPQQIVAGQYLGFSMLVAASLAGFFGGQLFPDAWIGLLGIFPIMMGFNRLLNPEAETEAAVDEAQDAAQRSWLAGWFSPQTCGVATVTMANGGDNLSIYVPLFASSNWESLAVILVAFFCLVSVWCYSAYRLAQVPVLAEVLARYGNYLVPFLLIGLGIFILMDSHTLENRGLAALAAAIAGFCLLTEAKKAWI